MDPNRNNGVSRWWMFLAIGLVVFVLFCSGCSIALTVGNGTAGFTIPVLNWHIGPTTGTLPTTNTPGLTSGGGGGTVQTTGSLASVGDILAALVPKEDERQYVALPKQLDAHTWLIQTAKLDKDKYGAAAGGVVVNWSLAPGGTFDYSHQFSQPTGDTSCFSVEQIADPARTVDDPAYYQTWRVKAKRGCNATFPSDGVTWQVDP